MREMCCQQSSSEWPVTPSLCPLQPLPLCQMLFIPVLMGFPSYPMQILSHAAEDMWIFFRAETPEAAVQNCSGLGLLSL